MALLLAVADGLAAAVARVVHAVPWPCSTFDGDDDPAPAREVGGLEHEWDGLAEIIDMRAWTA